jgi:outer membrane murein-binding lipoprotein Lpp
MHRQERLAEAARKLREQERLLHRREATCNMIQEQKKHWQGLKKQLDTEGKDLERLDGITLQNFWHSLKGTKDIAKHKEQEEYLAAKLKFDGLNANLENLERDIRRIDRELKALGDPQGEYQQAIQDKESYLLRSGGPDARRLFEVAEQLGCLRAESKELEEAIDTGQIAAQCLSEVEKSLGSAQGWGIVDILGGGLLTTAVKHAHIGSARDKISQAQKLLRNFQTELADVQKTNDSIEIGGLATLADFLLDGLLFDWIVQSQINTAQNRTRQLKQKIQSTIQDLYQAQKRNMQAALELDEERKRIIETASISPRSLD